MTYVDNPKLTQELLKLPFPLADYRKFSQAWPHKAEDIEDLHRALHRGLHRLSAHLGKDSSSGQ